MGGEFAAVRDNLSSFSHSFVGSAQQSGIDCGAYLQKPKIQAANQSGNRQIGGVRNKNELFCREFAANSGWFTREAG
jgi:hypothetical protein